jgi:hypothetical protein
MANDDGAAARRFHQATKHSLESLEREPHVLDWENLPLPFKVYRGLSALELPLSRAPSGVSAIAAVTGRAEPVRVGERPGRGGGARRGPV